LLVHRKSRDSLALKVINVKEHPDAREEVIKEIELHKRLYHENVIKFFGSRVEETMVYMFLEYASGGELYDCIEPDVGMPVGKAQGFFEQIIKGVEYIHSKDIVHRDLKPENILLDSKGRIKISDFGLATKFRMNGIERLLEKRCGTLPYVAPEVLTRPYKGEPADVWSCGIILVALLAGELPWDSPLPAIVEYQNWKEGKMSCLWKKMDLITFALIKRILCPYPSKRVTVAEVLRHPFLSRKLVGGSNTDNHISIVDDAISKLCYSQPDPQFQTNEMEVNAENLIFSFSQPSNVDEFFLSSQLSSHSSPLKKSLPMNRIVKRMTRFFVSTSLADTVLLITGLMEKFGYSYKTFKGPLISITISTVDRRKMILVFKANVIEMGNQVLLDFRLSRGDGLEFKKSFMRIKQQLNDIELKGPITWPLAVNNIN